MPPLLENCESKYFNPLIGPSIEAQNIEITRGMFGANMLPNLTRWPRLTDFYLVMLSLGRLRQQVNGEPLTQLARQHQKAGSSLPEGEFLISNPVYSNYAPNLNLELMEGPKMDDKGEFWKEGEYGFGLGFKPSDSQNKIWLAVLGFNKYFDEPFKDRIPYILQLQGGYHRYKAPELDKAATKVLATFRWEFVMLDLMVKWAQDMRLPAIALQPASKNMWVNGRHMPIERGKLRYDITAQKYGFTQLPNEDYILYLGN